MAARLGKHGTIPLVLHVCIGVRNLNQNIVQVHSYTYFSASFHLACVNCTHVFLRTSVCMAMMIIYEFSLTALIACTVLIACHALASSWHLSAFYTYTVYWKLKVADCVSCMVFYYNIMLWGTLHVRWQ